MITTADDGEDDPGRPGHSHEQQIAPTMPDPPANTKPYVQPGDQLLDFLPRFWQRQVDTAEQETPDFRHPPLPLARIKKVMKSDPDVKMIAADAPVLFCKACEIFIEEITARAFIVADANKRRTLSRSDIAKALNKSDQFDFLIDIVPREEPLRTHTGSQHVPSATAHAASTSRKSNAEMQEHEIHTQSHSESLEMMDANAKTPASVGGGVQLDDLSYMPRQ